MLSINYLLKHMGSACQATDCCGSKSVEEDDEDVKVDMQPERHYRLVSGVGDGLKINNTISNSMLKAAKPFESVNKALTNMIKDRDKLIEQHKAENIQ